MLANKFFDSLRPLIDEIERTQLGAIDEAAGLIAESLANDGALHIYDTGHMLTSEAINRAGGLMAIAPLVFAANVNNPVRPRPGEKPGPTEDELEGFVRYSLSLSNLRPGDVLILGSVSGRRPLPVELALQVKSRGVKLVVLTSVGYSRVSPVDHSSGKRLYELADVLIDNVGVVGDALVTVEGLSEKICPSSGITAAVIIWALTAQVVEHMLERGIKPHVWRSVNLPGAAEVNKQALKEYEAVGY